MRKFFAKVHLWLSIPFGIIIAIVCLTGAILVFETEILELGYPSRDELINWYYRGKRPQVLLIPTPGR